MSRALPEERSDHLVRELRDLHAFQGFAASLVQEESEPRAAELVASAMVSFWEAPLGTVAVRPQEGEAGWDFYGELRGAPLDAGTIQKLREALRLVSSTGAKPIVRKLLGPDFLPELSGTGVGALYIAQVRSLRHGLGALLLGTSEAEELSSGQQALLAALANHLATSLQNARLRRSLREQSLRLEDTIRERTAKLERREKEQRTLLEIARTVSRHLDRRSLFHAVADAVASAVTFDRLGIVLPRPEPDGLLLYAFEARNKRISRLEAGRAFPRSGTVPGWVLEHRRPFVGTCAGDLSAFPVSRQVLCAEGMESSCALPLLVEDRAVGVLVFHAKEQGRYKPSDLHLLEEVAALVTVALDNCLAYEEIKQLKDQLARENIYLQEEIKNEHNFEEIVGKSAALRKVLRQVEMVAPTDSSVLITAETGTGKELIARAIHHLSKRKDRPLIKVNCAALPGGLIESELFGHEKGAFTGAISRKIGRFELADRGTLFLDEIGDLPEEVQAKLLRVLQEHEFERVGGTQIIRADVRVIAATNRDLGKAVTENQFRADLYYRLNVFPVELPPLRKRQEDIPLLVRYLVGKYTARMGKRIEKISHDTMTRLVEYPWPGNIRELANVVERAVILSQGSTLEISDEFFSPSPAPPGHTDPYPATLQELERGHILKTLEKTRWMIEGPKGAARLLNLRPSTLRSRMAKLDIKRPV